MKVTEEYLRGCIEDSIKDNQDHIEKTKNGEFRESLKNDMIAYWEGRIDAYKVVLRMI